MYACIHACTCVCTCVCVRGKSGHIYSSVIKYPRYLCGNAMTRWSVHNILARVNNKRGECLMPYSPVIDDCAEVKWLLFHVTYRLASIFSHLTTKAIPDTRACIQLHVQVHHEEHRSVA